MNALHQQLHERALFTAKEYLKREAELIGVFQELDDHRTFECYGMPSLFAYATKVLGLSEATTTALTSITRAARKVPELKAAIEEKRISFSNARRIAPVLKKENKSEWLEKASKLPVRALELELAKSFPDRPAPTRMFPKSETLGRIEVDLSNAAIAKLKRAQEILSQKKKANVAAAAALEILLDEFIERHDPLEKAKRAQNRIAKVGKPVTRPVTAITSTHHALARQMGFSIPRKAIPAKEKHAVILRDQAQCTHLYPDGSRCESRNWLEFHHLHAHAKGGPDSVRNLRTFCSSHHSLEHHDSNRHASPARLNRTNDKKPEYPSGHVQL